MITIEIIPDLELGGYTARVPDIPAYGEGDTEEEAIQDLKIALRGFVAAFGLDEALGRMTSPSAIRHVDWELKELASQRRLTIG